MKKKSKNIEMRIYELLGVKKFRELAFECRNNTFCLLSRNKSKDDINKELYNKASNYNIGKIDSLEDIIRFKKGILFNTLVHIVGVAACMPGFFRIITGTGTLSTIIIIPACMVLNLYCLMLQRYNTIRINKVIKKMIPKYEKQKDIMKNELKKEDAKLLEHSYKIVDKKKETNIEFDELIENANIEQLKIYKECLLYFNEMADLYHMSDKYVNNEVLSVKVPVKRNKSLKLELIPKINE